MDLIDTTRCLMEEELLQLVSIVKSYSELIGEADSPPWLFVLGARVFKLDEAAHAYMMAVHEAVSPVLQAQAPAVHAAPVSKAFA
ncbi:MAG: hypothetical protein Q8S32_11505 [Burkholderiaceae bacterium]|nr:hypothetical protein [Burkholderiaceae bacterium]